MNTQTRPVNVNDESRFPFFKGYPYLVIRIAGNLFHLTVLSEQETVPELGRLAQAQANANKIEVCLVLSEKAGVYFSSKHKPHFSEQIPKGGIFLTNKLKLAAEPRITADLLRRKGGAETFVNNVSPKSGYLLGDLQKGGREASPDELLRLRGIQENGLPKGLEICRICEDYRGECLDPSPQLRGLVVKVCCYCQNDVFCARCGNKLHKRKPDSNSYQPKDSNVWHTPSFCGLSHECP